MKRNPPMQGRTAAQQSGSAQNAATRILPVATKPQLGSALPLLAGSGFAGGRVSDRGNVAVSSIWWPFWRAIENETLLGFRTVGADTAVSKLRD